MIVAVRLFGPQAQLVAARELAVELRAGADRVGDLRAALAVAAPELVASLPASRVAVNHRFADDSVELRPSDEVALIGMVGGG